MSTVQVGTVEVDALDVIGSLSATVQLRNVWRLRFGLWLLRLAARVLRCDVTAYCVEVGDAGH